MKNYFQCLKMITFVLYSIYCDDEQKRAMKIHSLILSSFKDYMMYPLHEKEKYSNRMFLDIFNLMTSQSQKFVMKD